ncbi:MAG: DUF5011 domain-containing protein [Nitrosopumilus sp.]|nr:DUF5011 domain-containing protein [Nitrosopumilus sp.]MDA7943962.1 DUF5011 domain-containing protein [Nitrosopumilus sp.]MDA7999383.1 DUF5011 domain-containing protein [Nitrosopumilus sp.]
MHLESAGSARGVVLACVLGALALPAAGEAHAAFPAGTLLLGDPETPAYLRDATTYEHGLTCIEIGDGSDVSERIAFDPPLAALTGEDEHPVTIYCPDSNGDTYDDGNSTVLITVDRTPPPEPAALASLAIHTRPGYYDPREQEVLCIPPFSGSPLRNETASFTMRLSGEEVAAIPTSAPSTGYTIEFECRDEAGNRSTLTQALTIMNRPPVITGLVNNTTFEVGNIVSLQLATCDFSTSRVTTPAVRSDPPGFDVHDGSFGFAEDSRKKVYRFNYTCTDETDGQTTTAFAINTQVSGVPHLDTSAFSYNADGRQSFASVVDSFHGVGDDYEFMDARCYHYTSGEFQAPDPRITGPGAELAGAIKGAVGRHVVSHACTVDGRSNALVHTVYTTERDAPVLAPLGGPVSHPLGHPFTDPAACSGTGIPGTGISIPRSVSGPGSRTDLDVDHAGDYAVTYTCVEAVPATAHHEGGTLRSAPGTLVVRVAEAVGPVLSVPAGRVFHELGTAFDIADHAICTGTSGVSLSVSPVIGTSTAEGAYGTTVSCTNGTVTRTAPLAVVVRIPGMPLITLNGENPVYAWQHFFEDPGAECLDLEEGRLDAASAITGPDGSAVDAADMDHGRHTITYTCSDSVGNEARPANRTVYVGRVGDNLPPVISINGFSTLKVKTGDTYKDPGATCHDANYGDLPVVARVDVDTSGSGPNTVTYTCTDGTFTVTAKRTIEVVAEILRDWDRPVIHVPGPFVDFVYQEVPSNLPSVPPEELPADFAAAAGPPGTVLPGSRAMSGQQGIVADPGTGDPDPTFVPPDDDHGSGGEPQGIIVVDPGTDDPDPTFVSPDDDHDHSGGDHLAHRRGTEFVPPTFWCIDGRNPDGTYIHTAATVPRDIIPPSTGLGDALIPYSCRDAAGLDAIRVFLRLEVEEGPPPEPSLLGDNPMTLLAGQRYVEHGAECDDDHFNRFDRPQLPVIMGGSARPPEFSMPGTYEIRYACASGEAASGIIARTVIVRPGVDGGDDEDWQESPTFGRAWAGGEQLVTGGFSFNGMARTITDNYHVDFERASASIGGTNTVTMKAFSDWPLEEVILSLGVPEISRATDAEAEIKVRLGAEYGEVLEYAVVDIIHEQEEGLVDPGGTAVAVGGARCNASDDAACHEFTIQFVVTAPLKSDVMAISAMDVDRRITTTYVNDGVEFTGEPILPARTAEFVVKRGNQHPAETVRLVQEDRRYDVWTDQDGFAWTRNSYGSWLQLTHAGFERPPDPGVSVMTRIHDGFAGLVEAERERALLVFDSGSIEKTVGGSFSIDAPVRTERLTPELLALLQSEEARAVRHLQGGR